MLLACFGKEDTRICVVQMFEKMEISGESLTNSFDCPLLTLTSSLCLLRTTFIHSAISIVHECTEQCVFVQVESCRMVEREAVKNSSLVFQHDYDSLLYCLNVYCMNH